MNNSDIFLPFVVTIPTTILLIIGICHIFHNGKANIEKRLRGLLIIISANVYALVSLIVIVGNQ